MSTVKDMIDESIVGKLKEGNGNIAQAIEDVKGLRESEARINNIIVFKAKEPESLLAEDGKRGHRICNRNVLNYEKKSKISKISNQTGENKQRENYNSRTSTNENSV